MPMVHISKEFSKMTEYGKVKVLTSIKMDKLTKVNSKMEKGMVKESLLMPMELSWMATLITMNSLDK